MRPIHLLAALAVVILWGMNFVPMKIAVGTLPPIFLTGLRMAATAAILIGFVAPPRGHFRQMLLLSAVMGTAHYGLIFSDIAGVDVAVTAIVIQLGVPFSAILARVILGDRFGWRRTLGLVVAFCGVVVLANSILSYYLWYRLLTLYPVSNVIPVTLLAPVGGGLSGIVLPDELLTWEKIIGGAMTIGGVAVIQLR